MILDLDGDGIEISDLDESSIFFDINGDGYRNQVAWAGPDGGFLAYDKDGNDLVTDHDEIVFTGYVAGAQIGLEGLAFLTSMTTAF